ncbi:hypothetical protein WMY93_015354 [Mugilogobius chulae]|uniref:Fibronectin type-III domain-containing protein n=1 Tax=Mugilogobius chulae TaxID=88201 RepID=A0AAW0NSJ8_9GOBI
MVICPITLRCQGKVLQRCFELREEICQFLESKGKDTTQLRDETFLCEMAFLCDITSHLNAMNLQLQGRGRVISDMYSTVKAFKTKLTLWQAQMLKENLSHFPSCQTMKEKLSKSVFQSAQFADKLSVLAADFQRRFADFEAQKSRFELLSNPFPVDVESSPPNLQMELIELQCSDALKAKYTAVGAAEFGRFLPDTMPSCAPKLLKRSQCLAARTSQNLSPNIDELVQKMRHHQVRVGAVNTLELTELSPITAYGVQVFALHGETVSAPLEGVGVTLPVPFAGALRITDVTHSSMRLDWDAAPAPVRKYLITYKPEEGDLKRYSLLEVDGGVVTTVLTRLTSQTEYDVAVTPIYDQGPAAPMLNSAITDVVPAPKNLRTSEVTQTSFRATWEHGAPDVALYRLSWTKRGDSDAKFAILNADETFHVLPDLDPDTEYSVTVTAIYPDESESEDLMGSERTRQPTPKRGAPWHVTCRAPDPSVQVGGKKTTALMQKLRPDTDYSVSVAAVYASAVSGDISTQGKTKPFGGVRNLQVLNPTMTTLNVRWEPAEGKVKEYRVIYVPAAGGAESMEQVSSTTTSTVLRGLTPDTLYTVSLLPIYAEGEGRILSENGKTRPLGGVKNLKVTNPTMTSLDVDWEPADGAVRLYKVFYVPAAGGKEEMEQVPATTTSTVLRNLQPDTLYTVSVLPVYPAREGKRQSEDGKTLPLGGVDNIKVSNPTITTLKVTWSPADGNVQGYKVVYAPVSGGLEIVEQVSESTTTTVLEKLLPNTEYKVTVIPVYAEGDGPSLTDNGKTKPLGFVRNLQVTDPTTSTLNVRWDPAEGNVREYIVIWVPAAGGEQDVDQVSGSTTTTVLKNLEPNTEYTVTVVPVYPEMEGKSMSSNGKTNPMGGVKNLKVVDPTVSTLTARWEPAPGNVRIYKVFYAAQPGGEEKMEEVSGGTTSLILQNLNSNTVYKVAVVPVYPDVEGIRQEEQGKTKPLGAVKNLKVTDPTISSLRVQWDRAEGDVRQYKILYKPAAGGEERTTSVSGVTTTTVLRELSPDTPYRVTVIPVYSDMEGKPASDNGKTNTSTDTSSSSSSHRHSHSPLPRHLLLLTDSQTPSQILNSESRSTVSHS